MTAEIKPHQPTLFDVPKTTGRGGSYVDTRPFIPHEELAKTKLTITSNELVIWATKKPRGVTYWQRIFTEQVQNRKLDTETARKLYADPHFKFAYQITDSETLGESPEVLRQKLMDKKLGAMQAYRLGVLAIRKPQEGEARESVKLGFKLIERAAREDPTNPRYPRAYVEEALEIRRKNYVEKKKLKKEKKKTYSGEYSVAYYAEKVDHWTRLFEKHAGRKRIELHEAFKKRHESTLKSASLYREKSYQDSAINRRLEAADYTAILHDPELNFNAAYFWGSVALTTPTERMVKGMEDIVFMFFNKMYELADNYQNANLKNYYKAFAAWVNKEELFKKKCQVEPKRQAKAKAWHKEIERSQII